MIKYEDNVSARLSGNNLQPLSGATVTVTDNATSLPAFLYEDAAGTTPIESLATDDNGYFGFYAPDGEYTLTFTGRRFKPFTRQAALQSRSNIAKVSELAAASGAGLVGFIHSGLGWIVRSILDKLRETVSVYDAGVIADGDGLGGGTDQADLFLAAVNSLANKGGGVMRVPFAGTGYIRIAKAVSLPGKVTIKIDPRMSIDFGTNGQFKFTGSFGDEIAIAANLNRDDTVITTVAPHGLVVGDWILLKSQRACLHPDAGADRIGETTANTRSTFFAEPCQVRALDPVSPGMKFTVATPLIFSNYRTDRTQETYTGNGGVSVIRASATVAKINFVRGIRIIGGHMIANGASPIRFETCYEPKVLDTTFYMNKAVGTAVRTVNCMRSFVRAKASRDADTAIIASHEQYNSFKDCSSWWGEWDVEDVNGSQGIDVSWNSDTHPSIGFDIRVKAYHQRECAAKIHPGCYGGVLRVTAIQCQLQGASIAGMGVRVIDPYVVGPNSGANAGITFTAWGGIGGGLRGGYIEGHDYGVDLQRTGDTTDGPVYRNLVVEGVRIKDAITAIFLRGTDTNTPTAENSGIEVRNITLEGISGTCVSVGSYVNGAIIENIRSGDMVGGGTTRVVYLNANSVGCAVRNITSGNATFLVNALPIADTTTFPLATYPTNRHKIDRKSLTLLGTGTIANLSTSLGGSFHNRTTDWTLAMCDADQEVSVNSASARVITVPLNATVAFPIGTEISLRQVGAGDVTVTPASGVTVNSRTGLRLGGQYAVATLRKVSADIWYLYGDTRV